MAQVRRIGIRGEEGGALVEAALELSASSSAGFVAAGYQDHPVFRARGGFGTDRGCQGRLPVFFCEGNDILGRDFRGAGVDGVGDGGGEEGFGFFEPGLQAWCEGAERVLGVGVGEDGEGKEEGGGEVHGCGWWLRLGGCCVVGVCVWWKG